MSGHVGPLADPLRDNRSPHDFSILPSNRSTTMFSPLQLDQHVVLAERHACSQARAARLARLARGVRRTARAARPTATTIASPAVQPDRTLVPAPR